MRKGDLIISIFLGILLSAAISLINVKVEFKDSAHLRRYISNCVRNDCEPIEHTYKTRVNFAQMSREDILHNKLHDDAIIYFNKLRLDIENGYPIKLGVL